MEIKTTHGRAQIQKPVPGLELQHWQISHPQPAHRLKLKAPHFHDEWQIGFLEAGIIENTYRNIRQAVRPGQLYLVQPGEVHAEDLLPGEALRFAFALVAPARLAQALEQLTDGRQQQSVQFDSLLIADPRLNQQLVRCTAALFATAPQTDALEQEAGLLMWLTAVLASRRGTRPPPKIGNERRPVAAVRQYLIEHFAEAVSLDELARVACLSKFHLLRAFVKETGMTIHDYQMQLRICAAKTRLHQGQRAVEVALALGFFDQAHFSRCFKRFTSQTPGQYGKPGR